MGEQYCRTQSSFLLIVLDEDSDAIVVCAVGRKGVQKWVVRKVSKEFEGWGYGGNPCILKFDGEPSIVALKRSMRAYLELKGKLETFPPWGTPKQWED